MSSNSHPALLLNPSTVVKKNCFCFSLESELELQDRGPDVLSKTEKKFREKKEIKTNAFQYCYTDETFQEKKTISFPEKVSIASKNGCWDASDANLILLVFLLLSFC